MSAQDIPTSLFSEFDLPEWLAARQKAVSAELAAFEAERVLQSDIDALTAYMLDRHALHAPRIARTQWYTDAEEDFPTVEQDASGQWVHRLDVRVPFEGEEVLLGARVSAAGTGRVPARIEGRFVVLAFSIKRGMEAQARALIERELNDVERSLGWIERQVGAYNEELRGFCLSMLETRRQSLLAHRELIASIGVSVKPRGDGATPTLVTQHELPPMRNATTAPQEPLRLSPEALECIVTTARTALDHLDYSPELYGSMSETSLRDHCVLQFNASLAGPNAGDAFRGSHSEGFALESEGQPVLTGRCLIWSGPEAFRQVIDDLLDTEAGYAPQRMLLVFAPYRRSKAVQVTLRAMLETHPNVWQATDESPGRIRATFGKPASPPMALTILVTERPQGSASVATRKPRKMPLQGIDQMGFGF
jgi:hypothetical protein